MVQKFKVQNLMKCDFTLSLFRIFFFLSFVYFFAYENMSETITKFIERHPTTTRLTLTAVAASVLTASALLGYQSLTRPRMVTSKKTKTSVDLPTFISIIDEEAKESVKEKMDETLVLELLARNIAFFGEEGVKKIRNSFVIILGSGAVGSWTALMLARSGVEHIRIVDSGIVRLETMSRNSVAKISDIGKSKATIMKKYLAEIAPNAEIEPVKTRFNADTMEELLAGNPDYVVDTLPDVKDKVLLAKYCKEKNIKIMSAMSAGAKADPTLLQITDISDTVSDPLARMYRRQLRKFGIDRGIPVVYSTEKSTHVGDKGNAY
jgi:tRNA A37 threonylcarbamoyladenosine dehydratase